MGEERWKRCERAIAKLLHGQRVIKKGVGMEDVEHPIFSIEVKSREYVPKWLTGALKQAIANAPKAKVPIVVIHEVSKKYADDLVVLRLRDFAELVGELNEKSNEKPVE